MATAKERGSEDRGSEDDRRVLLRYSLLTAVLAFPLILAFFSLRNVYPFAASTMMLADRDMQASRDYYVLRGETVAGQTIDLPPITLTNALTGRNWSLVSAAIENKAFTIAHPHPENTAVAAAYGGVDKLPRAKRLDDLLRAWGAIYNSRLSATSGQRLRAMRLDTYRWEGGIGGEYNRLVQSWTILL